MVQLDGNETDPLGTVESPSTAFPQSSMREGSKVLFPSPGRFLLVYELPDLYYGQLLIYFNLLCILCSSYLLVQRSGSDLN